MTASKTLSGQTIDIAPFGRMRYWIGNDPMTIEGRDILIEHYGGGECLVPASGQDEGASQIGVEWEYPRQFSHVIVRFRDAAQMPSTKDVRLQYWQRNWPPAFHGGWTAVDDPYNGQWINAHCEIRAAGDTWTFDFDPLDISELPHAEDFAVTYRQSYRVRLLFKDGSTPEIAEIKVFSDSIWRVGALEIEFLAASDEPAQVSVHNGYILSLDDSNPNLIGARILYAETKNYGVNRSVPWEPDRTVVSVNHGETAFSFLATDALTEGVRIPDLGVVVGNARRGVPESPDCADPDSPGTPRRAFPTVPIYDRILTQPEQSYERASREIPHVGKTSVGPHGRYVPIGCEANRQEFAVRYNAEIFADKHELKVLGRDTAKLLWPGKAIFYKFPTGDPPDFRCREDGTEQSALNGCLPIYTSEWKDREFVYEMTSFAALLSESPWDEEKKRGDEPIIALSRIRIRNTTEEKRTARFWIVVENPEELALDEAGFIYATGRARDDSVPDAATQKRWVVEKYPARRLRAHLDIRGRGNAKAASCTYAPFETAGIPNAIAYDIELEPRMAHEIELFIPFITFTGDEGRREIEALDYDAKLAEMADYWQKQIEAGARIEVPERDISDFVKATIPHIGITVDKDIKSGYYMLPAGTFSYPVCMNEACHQIRSLDYRGHHERARKYLRPFYELQGTQGMHGKFKSKEGVFHGLSTDEGINYQGFNYNLDHGYVTFAMCEHYKFTRDREWLKSVADRLVAACDFVTRERQATMLTDPSGEKVWEYGLLPPGHLEDNPEWLYWYAVNGHCYRGMKAVTEVLADIGHPEVERLVRDAAAYRDDIRRAMKRSCELAPVVRLADGTFSPFVPTRCGLRGRDIGWLRDSLYPAMHTIECGVLEPNEDMATWILKDTEDNVFVSRYRGRQVDLERFWFSQGGNTIQSGLLPIVMIYLKRGQPEHAIRALFNGFAQNIYRDVRCFIEHPVAAFGLGAGPFYKTPDENCWINWLRNVLLMEIRNPKCEIRNETGEDCLTIAPGAPRKWFAEGFSAEGMATYFGPVSYSVSSDGDAITAIVRPPKRNPPALLEVTFRRPDRKPIKSVSVNGRPHDDFDPAREIVRFSNPAELPDRVEIVACNQ